MPRKSKKTTIQDSKEKETKVPGFVVPLKGIGKPVDEGTYEVRLTKVEANNTQKGDPQLILTAAIDEQDNLFHGRSLIRRFVIPSITDPEKDISGILYYMREALMAFGADEDEVSDDNVDALEVGQRLIGNKAVAEVKHQQNDKNPDKPYVNANFLPLD